MPRDASAALRGRGGGSSLRDMELRDFAARVLFANTLEEKLLPPPEALTDHAPGAAMGAPESPGRPEDLRFSGRGERAPLPKAGELRGEKERAVLLHAFANHELLATELMALALLKFPDAPPEFRRGLLRTLRDEQEHTRLYMERMAACGLRFGELPVNGFFWRNISDMESPADYVSRLSLTFEQANLDYARHYGGLFAEMGDADTAALLDRIYKDEIAHVGYGLKWFRRWKEPGRADWDAFRGALRFPLSPARAKGNAPFNREGRRKAGFDAAFIEALELFNQSRGRTPRVAVFNPSAEACALSGSAETARRDGTTAALARDLDVLPFFTCLRDDVVLLRQEPSREHLAALLAAGIAPPQYEVLTRGGKLPPHSELPTRKLARLCPWGWSADSAELLAPLLPMTGEEAFADIPWDAEIRMLYAKTTAAGLAAELRGALTLPEETAGVIARSEDEVREALRIWAEAGHAAAVLKAPFGIAGRGLHKVSTAELAARDFTWLAPVLHQQGAVVVEPWLERVADFSCQYDLTPGETPRLKGMTRLHTDARGGFLGCSAGPSFGRLMPPEAARALHTLGVEEWYRGVIAEKLAALPGMARLQGWLGIDAFVYRDAVGGIRVRPVVEINPRCTMGRVTLELKKFVRSGRTVMFRVLHARALEKRGWATPEIAARELRAADPLVMEAEESGAARIGAGTLVLNDAARAEAFLAVLSVTRGGGGGS